MTVTRGLFGAGGKDLGRWWESERRYRRRGLNGLRRWKGGRVNACIRRRRSSSASSQLWVLALRRIKLPFNGSPDPLRAVAAAPVFVAGVLTFRMMAGVDGKHVDPDSSEILLRSLNSGKSNGGDCTATVQFPHDFSVRLSNLLAPSWLVTVEAAGVEPDDHVENTQLIDSSKCQKEYEFQDCLVCCTVAVQRSPRIPRTPNFHLRTPSFDEKHSEVRE